MNTDFSYPIGKYQAEELIDRTLIDKWINEMETLPLKLSSAVSGFNEEKLDTPYRADGWTIRQVIHHIADSHMNAYIRFKLALTEDKPLIKPYDEKLWAELPDIFSVSIDVSLELIKSLHARWTGLLKKLGEEDLNKEFLHPESGTKNLKETIGHYAWHGNHHLAHITKLKERMKW